MWENLGWHYCVTSIDGQLSIHTTRWEGKIQYCAFLNDDSSQTGGGLALWTDSEIFEDPRDAVRYQADLAMEKATALLNQAKRAQAVRVAMDNFAEFTNEDS